MEKLCLSGKWEVYIDFTEKIENYEQVSQKKEGWKEIDVPGCWEQIADNKKADGPVWYKKTFQIPDKWADQQLTFLFEGINYYCEIWLNGSYICSHEGGWNGFSVDIARTMLTTSENELLIKVYKQGERFPIREHLAGFLPDVTTIFGGIWKPVYVYKQPEIEVTDTFIKPCLKDNSITVEGTLFFREIDIKQGATLHLNVKAYNGEIVSQAKGLLSVQDGNLLKMQMPMGENVQLWTPSTPYLYELELKITDSDGIIFEENKKFGMREVTINENAILLNGQSIYLRGVLHWGWYAEHVAPIPSKEEIREELQRIKDSGFNMVKHCLYIPIQEYFEIADELGIIIWQELPMWLPEVTDTFKERVFYQYERIIKEIRNHPSILLWTLGCELGDGLNSQFLEELYTMTKELTNDAIIRDNSGSGECYGGLLKEYADFYDYHFYTDVHFYRDLLNQFGGPWREKKPWLFGEFCDYDVFRNIKEVKLQDELPWWLKNDESENPGSRDQRWRWCEQEDRMEQLNLPFSDESIHENSVKSAFVYRKLIVELIRQYPLVKGYTLTSIKSNPIATSGIFDDKDQPYHEPDEFEKFNSDTVLLLTWDNKRDWVNGGDRLVNYDHFNYHSEEVIRPHLYLSHYGSKNIEKGLLTWSVSINNQSGPIANGKLDNIEVCTGEGKELTVAEFRAPSVEEPQEVILSVSLRDGNHEIHNNWSFWVYPKPSLTEEQQCSIQLDDPLHLFKGLQNLYPSIEKGTDTNEAKGRVIITSQLRKEHYDFMESGGNVFYLQQEEGAFEIERCPFWRESIQLYHTHQVMDQFPHGHHTSLPLYSLATDVVFKKDSLTEHVPIMERLDARTFNLHTYMFEQNIGLGKLVASTLRFNGGLGDQPNSLKNNTAGIYLLDTVMKDLLK